MWCEKSVCLYVCLHVYVLERGRGERERKRRRRDLDFRGVAVCSSQSEGGRVIGVVRRHLHHSLHALCREAEVLSACLKPLCRDTAALGIAIIVVAAVLTGKVFGCRPRPVADVRFGDLREIFQRAGEDGGSLEQK